MVIIFALLSQAAYLNCLDSLCSSCSNNLIPYASLLCIERCPYPNEVQIQSCIAKYAEISFVRFSEFLNFSANSVNIFSTISGLPFKDPSKTSPIPTFNQGFYFTSTSGLRSVVSKVLSPDFKVFIMGLFKSDGDIFEVFYGPQSYFRVYAEMDLIIFKILALTSTESKYLNYSIQYYSKTQWMNLAFILRHSAGQVVIEISNRFREFNKVLSVTNIEYHPGSGDAEFLLGSTQGLGFKGFIFEFAYLLGPSIFDPYFIFRETCLCDFNEFCSSDKICTPCPQSSNDWPWCLRNDGSHCYTASCSSCTSFFISGCTSCADINKIAPFCDCGPYCTACSGLFQCTACRSEYDPIGDKCLNKPFGIENNEIKVLDYVFSSFEQYKFNVLQSGNDPNTFYPYNHEADDPVILNNRGAYLGPGMFFKSIQDFVINYQFALGFYFSGDYSGLIRFNELEIDTGGTVTIKLTGIETTVDVRIIAYYSKRDPWNLMIAYVKFENNISTVYAKFNHNEVESYSIEGFLFIQSKKQVTISTMTKNVMIYSLVIYKDFFALDDSYRKNDYRMKCGPSAYYNDYLKSCRGCESKFCSTFGSSHYCKYVECEDCKDVDGECVKTNNHKCLIEKVYYDGNCCHPTCRGCFDSHHFACLACYDGLILLGHRCVNSCPFGFVVLDGKCKLTIIQTAHIVFNDVFMNFTDKTGNIKVISGNESTTYPRLFDSHPIPVYSRGFYFRNTSYVNTTKVKMSFNFTLYFLIKFEKPGTILITNDFVLSMQDDLTVVVQDVLSSQKLTFNIFKLNEWLSVDVSFSASIYYTYKVECTVNGINLMKYFAYYIFTEDPTGFFFGNQKSSFTGFLYEFQAYNGIVTPSTTFKQCINSPDANCYISCNLNQVLSGTLCVDCKNCPLGCRNTDSCSLCSDPLCLLCTFVNPECYKCKENTRLTSNCECLDGFFLDTQIKECTRCSNNCAKCTSLVTCECFENSHEENLSCVCDDGFYMNKSGKCSPCHKSCLTCTDRQFFRCKSCSNFLLSSVCLENCPVSFGEKMNQCVRLSDIVVDLKFDGKFEIETIEGVITQAGQGGQNGRNKPTPAYMRGWHFNDFDSFKFESSSSKSLVGIKFSAFFWIKLSRSGDIFTISDHDIILLNFSVSGDSFSYEINLIDTQSFQFSSPFDFVSWMLVSLFLDYSEFSSVTVSINSLDFPWTAVSDKPFNISKLAKFMLGSSSSESRSFEGFIFEFHIKSLIINSSDFLTLNEFCTFSPRNSSCISNCDFQSFEDQKICIPCKSTCQSGCRSSKHCNLCEDEFCDKCLNFSPGACLACKENFYLRQERCAEICKTNQFLNLQTLRCENCRDVCLECEEYSKCTKCVKNSYLNESDVCLCLKGHELRLNETFECQETFFNVTLTVNTNNEVTLIFNESLEMNLTESMVIFMINDKVQNISITPLNSSWYLVIINTQTQTEMYDVLTINFSSPIYSKSEKILTRTQLTALLFGNTEDGTFKKYLQNVKFTTSSSVIIVTSVVFSFSFFGMDIKSFINFKNSAELFYSIVLLEIDFDPVVETVLSKIRYSSTLPSFFDYLISRDNGVALKSKFKKYGFNCNLFVLNSGMHLMLLLFLVVTYIFFRIIERVKPNKVTQKIIKKLEWDAFIKVWLNAYMELSLTAIISVFCGKFENEVQITDAFFSVIVLVRFRQAGNLAAIFGVFLVNRKYFSIDSNLSKKDFKEKFDSLLSVLRINTQSYYYIIFLIRRFSVVFIFLLQDLPTYQISFLLILSLLVNLSRTCFIWLTNEIWLMFFLNFILCLQSFVSSRFMS